jgi:hypothetical protein
MITMTKPIAFVCRYSISFAQMRFQPTTSSAPGNRSEANPKKPTKSQAIVAP